MAHLNDYQKKLFEMLENQKFDSFRNFTKVMPADNKEIAELFHQQLTLDNEKGKWIIFPYHEMDALKRIDEYFDLLNSLKENRIIDYIEDPKELLKEKFQYSLVLNENNKIWDKSLKVDEYIKKKEHLNSIIIAIPDKLKQYRENGYKTKEESYKFLLFVLPYSITTLLTIITILLTCNQSKLANLQTKIAHQSVLPLFIIKANPAGHKMGAEELTVRNDGANIFEFKCENVVRMDVSIESKSPKVKKEYSYYLNDYFDQPNIPETGRGLLFTSFAHQNEITYKNLKDKFDSLCTSKGLVGEIKLHRFIYLTYKDQLGEIHNEYHHIPEEYGSSTILNRIGEEVFKDAKENSTTNKTIYLHKLKPGDLIKENSIKNEK